METAITASVYTSLNRQVNHWSQAASRLSALDNLVYGSAWQGIRQHLGQVLRQTLQKSIRLVEDYGTMLKRQLELAKDDPEALRNVKRGLVQLREQYLKAEETIHFYAVAINSRITPNIAALLRACDILCIRSMEEILRPLGKEVPYILTYIDKGVGASILKAGLRLWDGNISPVAAVKITQHNLFRPTAIIHETGHQVAHILHWNEELSVTLNNNLGRHSQPVADVYSSWSSEIAADAFAFVHTGFAAVAALHDVVCGAPYSVFAYRAGDPHPISYLRVLMNIEMCRQFYGAGPWDDLELSFKNDYDIASANYPSVELIQLCVAALPDAVRLILKSPYHAFRNRSLSQMVPPDRVSPRNLQKLEYIAGPALYTSHAWLWKECIRILAINGYYIGIGRGDLTALYKQQEEWMIRLGFTIELN